MYSTFHFLSIIMKCPYILAHLAEEWLEKETFYLVYFFQEVPTSLTVNPLHSTLPCKCHNLYFKDEMNDCGIKCWSYTQWPAQKNSAGILLVMHKYLFKNHVLIMVIRSLKCRDKR